MTQVKNITGDRSVIGLLAPDLMVSSIARTFDRTVELVERKLLNACQLSTIIVNGHVRTAVRGGNMAIIAVLPEQFILKGANE